MRNSKKRIGLKNGQSVELVRKPIRVELINIGEGTMGDFDSDDPEDVNLLRFDVSRLENGSWTEIDDSSYCTQIEATTKTSDLKKLLKIIMDEIYDHAKAGKSIRRACECLSWIDSSWLKRRK